jgi:hypothetical protein
MAKDFPLCVQRQSAIQTAHHPACGSYDIGGEDASHGSDFQIWMSVLGIVVLDAKRLEILRAYIACSNPASRVRNTISAITVSSSTIKPTVAAPSHITSGEYT